MATRRANGMPTTSDLVRNLERETVITRQAAKIETLRRRLRQEEIILESLRRDAAAAKR